jgi:hypothetical protein
MPPSKARKGGDRSVEIVQQRIYRRAQLEHQRRVDDILAGRAPMHITGSLRVGLFHFGGQRPDHRSGDIARNGRGLAECGQIVEFGPAGIDDQTDRGRRNDPKRPLRAGKRGFEVKHALQAGAIIEDRAHRRSGIKGSEEGARNDAGHDGRQALASRTSAANPWKRLA